MTSEKEEPKEAETNKLNETIENIKKNKNVDDIITYAQNNTQDTIAYLLLITGIIWMFFQGFYGGVLIGLVVGFYFSKELIQFIRGINQYIEEQGLAKSLILGGGLFAFFVMAPGIIVGTAIMVALKFLLKAE